MQPEFFAGRYQVQEQIGRGGLSTVYRGRDIQTDRMVAIKVLRAVYSTDQKFVIRFQRGAKAASALQHPNIVQVYDSGQTDGNYFIVMELVEGTDLRRYARSRGVLDVDRALIIAHNVALGLGVMHRHGIVHRNIKPENILMGSAIVKLAGFGLAQHLKETLPPIAYSVSLVVPNEDNSPATDVYALGLVLYELVTGRTPFDGDTPVAVAMQLMHDAPTPPSQFNPSIPAALDEIILRCLEKEPGARFRDGESLARALGLLMV